MVDRTSTLRRVRSAWKRSDLEPDSMDGLVAYVADSASSDTYCAHDGSVAQVVEHLRAGPTLIG